VKLFHWLAVSPLHQTKHENLLICLLNQRKKDLHVKSNQVAVKGCVLYRIQIPISMQYKVDETVPVVAAYDRIDYVSYERL